jgi:hypothetical protein
MSAASVRTCTDVSRADPHASLNPAPAADVAGAVWLSPFTEFFVGLSPKLMNVNHLGKYV